MSVRRTALVGGPVLALALGVPLLVTPAEAGVTRTSGNGTNFDVSWTEYDPLDVLRLPGNVHVGYLFSSSGPHGRFVSGGVDDFQCDPGESPFGGDHNAAIADEVADIAGEAEQDAVQAVLAGSGSEIVDGAVEAAVKTAIADEAPATVEEEVEPCEFVQTRFLEGSDTATVTVDVKARRATVTGTLVVSNGGHGEPGTVIARPPVNITLTGGEAFTSDSSYSFRTANASFSDERKDKGFQQATVAGGIGAMGFADDADDESYASYSRFTFLTVERVR